MTVHRYSRRALAADYTRGGIGLALTLGPLALVDALPAVAWALGVAAAAFATHALRTALRHATAIVCDATHIAASGPLRTRRIDWASLDDLRLRYYSTRRAGRFDWGGSGGAGWMQLVLRGDGVTLRIESTLDGFADIVDQAAKCADAAGLVLAAPTSGNLVMLGVNKRSKGLTAYPRCRIC